MWGHAGHEHTAAAAAGACRESQGAAGEVQLKRLLAAVALHAEVRWATQVHRNLQHRCRVSIRQEQQAMLPEAAVSLTPVVQRAAACE